MMREFIETLSIILGGLLVCVAIAVLVAYVQVMIGVMWAIGLFIIFIIMFAALITWLGNRS